MNILIVFFIFIWLYHILSTILLFWLWFNEYKFQISLIKDVFFLLIVVYFIVLNKKNFFEVLKNIKYLLILSFWVLIWSTFYSYLIWKSLFDIFIWIKYWFFFQFIFIWAYFVWAYFSKYWKLIDIFIKKFYVLILFILLFWIVWNLAKFQFKENFYKIWYWVIWDYKVDQNPPLYYRTWKDWLPRFSWIFSWPNNLWFFLVWIFWFFYFYTNFLFISTSSKKINFKSKYFVYIKKWFLYLLYWICVIWTLSRWCIVWVLTQIFILFSKIKNKILLLFVVFVSLFWIWILFLWKTSSTIMHLESYLQSVELIKTNFFWFWLWTAWTSIHYNWIILTENIYFQSIIENWIFLFLLWIWFFVNILYNSIFKIYEKSDYKIEILKSLWIWLIWILVMWNFLHVFEDSMVNYLFFWFYWIIYWYVLNHK